MKKLALTLSLLACLATGFAQPKIRNVDFPASTDLFGCFELSFAMDEYENPYDPNDIHVYAVFVGPDNEKFTVDAFYYEGYSFKKQDNKYEVAQRQRDAQGWKVRFTPNATGIWKFTLYASDLHGRVVLGSYDDKRFSFNCKDVKSAKGFITTANRRYLKREVVVKGNRMERSFFPVGPNIGWYEASDYGRYTKPYGIYDYVYYIDKLAGNANFFRMWLNRYQYLSLYGPESTEIEKGKTRMYFDNSLNQKDAAELDYIVQYAMDHDVAIMPCIFNFRNFIHKSSIHSPTKSNPAMPSDWINNPYHSVLGLQSPYEFFTNPEAKRITKNLIRYIVARWAYATNILSWEFWNEVTNMAQGETISEQTQRDIADWHKEMTAFVRSIDPYHHLVTTSMGSVEKAEVLYSSVFDDLDIVQYHNYQNIQKASSREQFSAVLLRASLNAFGDYDKPFFMGEFGFGQDRPAEKYEARDPFAIDLHNSLWSSAFSGSMGPASFWWWNFLRTNDLFDRFKPVMTFLNQLPILSDSFTPATTGTVNGKSMDFPNNLETYYMVNAAEDTIYGWSQDVAFAYQSLRMLSDQMGNNNHFADDQVYDPEAYVYTLSSAKKPGPSSRRNAIRIPIGNQPKGTVYEVRWYDGDTGLEIPSETTTAEVNSSFFYSKHLKIQFPSSIRNTKTRSINNTFGDAVFVLIKK